MHGYNEQNQEVLEEVKEKDYVRKLISLDRILSIGDQYILVQSSHGRVMFWEYKDSLDVLTKRLEKQGLLL